jgi:hypothetical protein
MCECVADLDAALWAESEAFFHEVEGVWVCLWEELCKGALLAEGEGADVFAAVEVCVCVSRCKREKKRTDLLWDDMA